MFNNYYNTTTTLQLSGLSPGQPAWASTRRNIHSLTPIIAMNHPLSAFCIFYDPWHPPCSIYMPDSLFQQSLSKFSLVYLLAWHPPLHTPYISSPNHCLLFAAHAHTITTCFAVVPKLCHLILVSLSPFACLHGPFDNPHLTCAVASVHLHQGVSTVLLLPYLWPCFGILQVFSFLSFHTRTLFSNFLHYLFVVLNRMSIANNLCK